ncbi:Predicted arabinose efflux permease, MFS family [Paenibacillus sp. UNCCL117]|uniref:MFS transporter n=1 Tax=unclassified Paenibacillus TaxID=185978 RepID=UPI000884EF36|nr:MULTISPECIES: MFS transporter [unclassified Paenibacillus]SDC20625.1 Predicted arabinose efflux permease, MFS family [Paenibacillus sp. cl123]SFW18663.1 Predicted arabinose efflux permease, MFS family [Paenibacillus sp. UNCCL117]
MATWKINLIVLWAGQFLVMAGMTMIVPFLPLYLQEMGMHNEHEVAVWAGLIFAANFVTSFLFQPLWGGLADRYGRKVMLLRSGFGMAIVMTLMGFAGTAWHLLLLRMLNGTVAGFVPAGVALMSANTPREKMGFAMGTLQSGAVAGSILGPFIGGLLAEWVGFRPIFFITGGLLFAASLLVAWLVKETFDAKEAAARPKQSLLSSFGELRRTRQLPSLYAVTFLIQFSLLSVQPLLPLFVQKLHGEGNMLAFYAGLVGSVTGFSNMAAAPVLGRLADRIGPERILIGCLIGAGLASIPQALVTNVWQLLIARFFLGLFLGGLLPTVNALIRKHTPSGMESRSYSFNSSFLSLGNMLGPVVGGAVSGFITIQQIFLISSVLLLINAFWARSTLAPLRQAESKGSG